jgi:hypothetical protein
MLAQNADMPTSYAPSMLLVLLALGLHEATCFQTGAFRLPSKNFLSRATGRFGGLRVSWDYGVQLDLRMLEGSGVFV